MNPTLTFEFPADAANKIAEFKSGKGQSAWNNILREFEAILGVTPTSVKLSNVPGHVDLTTKILAGR